MDNQELAERLTVLEELVVELINFVEDKLNFDQREDWRFIQQINEFEDKVMNRRWGEEEDE